MTEISCKQCDHCSIDYDKLELFCSRTYRSCEYEISINGQCTDELRFFKDKESIGIKFKDILDRYDKMLSDSGAQVKIDKNYFTSNSHLRWMISQMRDFTWDQYGKFCRWLGFIQGLMIHREFTTVQAERQFTRKYFTNEDLYVCG